MWRGKTGCGWGKIGLVLLLAGCATASKTVDVADASREVPLQAITEGRYTYAVSPMAGPMSPAGGWRVVQMMGYLDVDKDGQPDYVVYVAGNGTYSALTVDAVVSQVTVFYSLWKDEREIEWAGDRAWATHMPTVKPTGSKV